MMTRMYRMVLGTRHELAFAADGAEGLEVAGRDPGLELMIVDVNMPAMDGLEFIRRLRGELGRTEVPVLVCSTEASAADQAAALAAGAQGFLAKPWTPAELLAAVGAHLPEAGA